MSKSEDQKLVNVQGFIRERPLEAFQYLCAANYELIDPFDSRRYLKHTVNAKYKKYLPSFCVGSVVTYLTYKNLKFGPFGKFVGAFFVGSYSWALTNKITAQFTESDRREMLEITKKYGEWKTNPEIIQFLHKELD